MVIEIQAFKVVKHRGTSTMTFVCGIMEKRGCPCMGEVNLLIKPERMGWLQFGEPSSRKSPSIVDLLRLPASVE